MAQFRRIVAVGIVAALGGATWSARAQTPLQNLGPVLTSPYDISTCICLERDISTRQAEVTVRANTYESLARQIAELEASLDRMRSSVDVNDQIQVDDFKARLERLDAMKGRQLTVTLPDYQG